MGKFNYKFESIKRIKETLEKKAQKEVAEIDVAIEKLKNQLRAIEEEETRERRAFATHILVAEIKSKKGYLASLKKKIEGLQFQINTLLVQREKKIEELVQKSKEHKIFDSLEDVYREQFYEEEKRLDMLQLNETATQRFVREKK